MLTTLGLTTPPPQLSAATHVNQLVPGDPDEVALLARLLTGFTDAAARARLGLAGTGLGAWSGATAETVAVEMGTVTRRLTAAEFAFEDAARAVARYADDLAAARTTAARALAIWQAAEHASAAARGTLVGVAVPAGADNADAELARAGALFQNARAALEIAAQQMAKHLDAARADAPKDPGTFSWWRRQVSSFGVGVFKGTAGALVGPAQAIDLLMQLQPVRLAYDRDNYEAMLRAFGDGFMKTLNDPIGQSGKALAAVIDLDSWRENPAEAAGQLLPAVLGGVAGARVLGTTRFRDVRFRLRSNWDSIQMRAANGWGIGDLDPVDLHLRIAAKNLDPDSTLGRATGTQLMNPLLEADEWFLTQFPEGTRLYVTRDIVTTEHPGPDARAFHESLQFAVKRPVDNLEEVGLPNYPAFVEVYEIRGGGIDGAGAIARANPSLGDGGAALAHVGDLDGLVEAGRLKPLEPHQFDPSTSLSAVEDPRFSFVDPDLPARPLDPHQAERAAWIEVGAKEAAGLVRGAAVVGAAAAGPDEETR